VPIETCPTVGQAGMAHRILGRGKQKPRAAVEPLPVVFRNLEIHVVRAEIGAGGRRQNGGVEVPRRSKHVLAVLDRAQQVVQIAGQ
jgi:hypothetical protein